HQPGLHQPRFEVPAAQGRVDVLAHVHSSRLACCAGIPGAGIIPGRPSPQDAPIIRRLDPVFPETLLRPPPARQKGQARPENAACPFLASGRFSSVGRIFKPSHEKRRHYGLLTGVGPRKSTTVVPPAWTSASFFSSTSSSSRRNFAVMVYLYT